MVRVAFCGMLALTLAPPAVAQLHVIRDPVPGTGAWTVVPNGDFETGDMTGWADGSSSRGVFRATDALSWAGTFSTHTESATGSGAGYFAASSLLTVTPGVTYIFSCFMNAGELTGGALYIDMSDIRADPHLLACFDIDGWQFVWRTWVADRSSVRIRIVRDGAWTPADNAYIDEIALTPEADFILPDSTYACYADCEPGACPGALDLFDFLCFQNAFAGADDYADCDASGVLDFFDFLCFQNAFSSGCP